MCIWFLRAIWLRLFFVCWMAMLVGAQTPPLVSQPNTTTAADSVVTFNEIMYHPPGGDPDMEWVELYNQMSVNLDISGWELTGGINFRFPTNTVFPANTYFVVSANPGRLRTFGASNVFGPFTGRLSSSSETFRVRNQSGRLMDEVDYEDEDPWPVGADGSGASLSKKGRYHASSPAANWRASAEYRGTPGAPNFPAGSNAGPKNISLISNASPSRWVVPANGDLGTNWIALNFDDTSWTAGSASFGYDTGSVGPVVLSNIALGKPVIDGSGAYANNPFDVPDAAGNFVAGNVTDGSDTDLFGVNYWLGREGVVNEYFTLDLGGSFAIEEIRLRNTHNAHHNDRGTADFEIWASQSIDSGRQLISPVRILSGSLANVSGLAPIPATAFSSANGLIPSQARFLKFVALTADNPGNNIGLNEIEVFAPTLAGPDRAFSFDGNLNDSSGAGLGGVNSGAQFSTNIPSVFAAGQSLQFDGVGSQVQITDSLDPTAYTIAFWVNVETVQSSSVIVRTSDAGVRSSWSHQLRINGAGRFEHYIFDGTGRSVAATNNIVPGQWIHVALTATNGGSIRIYINGTQSGPAPTISSLWTGGNQWRLGTDAGNAPNFFKGKIDELGIWHTVLTPSEIASLAAGRKPSQLGGYRRFFSVDVQDALYNKNTSFIARMPFELPSPSGIGTLSLRARYADGFVAFLNGIEVARRNAPQNLSWNSAATQNRSDLDAINFEAIDLTSFRSRLVAGRNVLAIHALNQTIAEPAFLFSAELSAQTAEFAAIANITFTEIGPAGTNFFVELQNQGTALASLEALAIRSSAGGFYRFSNEPLAPGAFVAIAFSDLGLPAADGDRLFLLGPSGELIDALEIHNRGRGRQSPNTSAPWFYTAAPTQGQSNSFSFQTGIVINEIMYHHAPTYRNGTNAFAENEEQWIELYNNSSVEVELAGWRFEGEVTFNFPVGTKLAPDGYLVVANNALALREKYPGIPIIGNFDKRLSHHAAHIILRDAAGNPADEVFYQNSHPWPSYANGGGSTLELKNPRADNSVPESWSDSMESSKTAWRRYTYRAAAVQPVYSPAIYSFHEFRIGLLDEGEAMIDNITVTELPAGAAPRQLLQNTNFSSGATSWRLLGNHSHSTVVPRPDNPNDRALRLVATGSTSYLDNRLETTLKVGSTIVPVVTGRQYEISFDAKWLAGSPQVHTELYYNKVVATTILDLPAKLGTPGRRNSCYVTNTGPVFNGLAHSPVIPKANEAIQVAIRAEDPDGVGSLRVFYSVNGGAWVNQAMTPRPVDPSEFVATLPGQANAAVIQFYVEGADQAGARATFPAGGRSSRALIKVDSTRTVSGKQTFRTIMTPADSTLLHSVINMMSDDLLGCTVVHNETEVFYDARIRLHGSMFSRNQPNLTGMTIKFPSDHRFRGSRESVIVRRRGLIETFVKHILNSAGGIPGNYDDVVHLVSHRSDNLGTARLNLANYDDTYIDSQFEGENEGTVYKLEGIREYQATDNGNPEGLKLSQPIGWIQSFDIANLGNDPEQYRWGIMIQNSRRRDDYTPVVAMAKAFSLSGTALKQAVSNTIDIDQWARLFALQSLLGIGDVYGVENPHNFAMYARSSDKRVVGLQNDWEFAFNGAAEGSIYGSKNVYKILRQPGFQRFYQGHILDLLDSVVNAGYFSPWAQHYTTLMGESYAALPGYASARNASARSQLAARFPFEITTGGGTQITVDTPTVTLQGRGWIDIYRIQKVGDSVPAAVTWLDDQRWQLTVPLASGTNNVELAAYNYRGVQVGQDSLPVVTTASEFPQRDYIRVSEIMYHPPPPTAEEYNAGFTDPEDFEFIELINKGPVDVSLIGVRFTVGIEFNFSLGAITNLAPFQRVLIVQNRDAIEFRYGPNLPIAGEYSGALSNGGELLRLVDRLDAVIHHFAYDDSSQWPASADGGGRSLESVDFSANYNFASTWRESPAPRGTPGSSLVAQPAFSALAITSGQIQVSFSSEPMHGYQLLYCDDLSLGTWTTLRNFPPRNQPNMEVIIESTSEEQRFFRLIAY